MTFQLHSQLKRDSFFVSSLPLSELRLVNDKRFPWLMLVPRANSAYEITDLTSEQQQMLMRESDAVMRVLKEFTHADKMNIANLGNVVSQLHIHIVARFKNDAAWPKPIWGHGDMLAYSKDEAQELIENIQEKLHNINLT